MRSPLFLCIFCVCLVHIVVKVNLNYLFFDKKMHFFERKRLKEKKCCIFVIIKNH